MKRFQSWTIMDYHGGGHHGLSLTVKDPRLSQKARLSWTIMDYNGLSQTIMDYHGLSWTIMDYHVSFFANIDSISTTLSSISTTLIFNLMTVYPQLFQYIHNLAQYIHNFNSVYPQPRSLLLSRCRDWKNQISQNKQNGIYLYQNQVEGGCQSWIF